MGAGVIQVARPEQLDPHQEVASYLTELAEKRDIVRGGVNVISKAFTFSARDSRCFLVFMLYFRFGYSGSHLLRLRHAFRGE